MLGPVARITRQVGRNVVINSVRNGSGPTIPGSTLPFNVHNRKWVTFHFLWFFGTAFGAPYVLLVHQMTKNNT